MKMNGGMAKADLGTESVDAVKDGCANLGRHIGNLKSFGVPVVVAINHFVTDTDAEVQAVKDYVARQFCPSIGNSVLRGPKIWRVKWRKSLKAACPTLRRSILMT